MDNKQMQPILTADSFRLNSGQFQVWLFCAGYPGAVKTADLIVRKVSKMASDFNIQIDHTTLHCLYNQKPIQSGYLPSRIRELLHLVELLLFSDRIYLSNTDGKNTLSISNDIINMLSKLNFTTSENEELIKFYSLTDDNYLNACKNASAEILREVIIVDDPINDLELIPKRHSHLLRPFGSKKRDYPKIAKLDYNSKRALNAINTGLKKKEFESTACVVLLNDVLNKWLKNLVKKYSDPENPIYDSLNTICRWKINEQLSLEASSTNSNILYVPSYGRSIEIKSLLLNQLTNLNKIELALTQNIEKEINMKENYQFYQSRFNTSCIPFFSLWAIQQTKWNNLHDFFKEIASFRQNKDILTIKESLSSKDINIDEADNIAAEIIKKYKLPNRIRWVWLLPFDSLGISSSGVGGDVDLKKPWTYRKAISVITNILDDINDKKVIDSALNRLIQITSKYYDFL